MEFDTSKLTFIGVGAFNDLREYKISENEKKYKNPMGFSSATDNSYERVYSITKQDYIDEGLQRELVGRFTCLASTNELGVEQLKRILVESSISPLTNLSKLCQMMGCKLNYDDEIVTRIAEIAYQDGCGARSLLDVVTNLKDVVSNDLINGNIREINITDELLDKSREVNLRNYNARSYK